MYLMGLFDGLVDHAVNVGVVLQLDEDHGQLQLEDVPGQRTPGNPLVHVDEARPVTRRTTGQESFTQIPISLISILSKKESTLLVLLFPVGIHLRAVLAQVRVNMPMARRRSL